MGWQHWKCEPPHGVWRLAMRTYGPSHGVSYYGNWRCGTADPPSGSADPRMAYVTTGVCDDWRCGRTDPRIAYGDWRCGRADPPSGSADPRMAFDVWRCGRADPPSGSADPRMAHGVWRCGTADPPSGSADLPTRNADLPLDDPVCGRPSGPPYVLDRPSTT